MTAAGRYIPSMLTRQSSLATERNDGANTPIECIDGDPAIGFLILCDHATTIMPAEYGDLGLPRRELERHIAYDIGARTVALELAAGLGAPAILTRFSRLLIDPNRDSDDPTLVMRIADRAVVPGNANIDATEIDARRRRFHEPYHRAIDVGIERGIAAGVPPALFSVHSFTPNFHGQARPWHATVLWDADPRLPLPLLRALDDEGDLVIGENVPYSGKLQGDTLYSHATRRGLAHALIEIRQDLIVDPEEGRKWGQRLARLLSGICGTPGLNEIVAPPPA